MQFDSVLRRSHSRGRPAWSRAGRFAAGVMAAALVASGTTAAASTGSPAVRASKAVKPDLGFYRGKTITFIIPQAVGGSISVPILAMQPYLQSYLGATINISYLGAGNGVTGENLLNASTPNGLTIGVQPIGAQAVQVIEGANQLNFDFRKLSYFGAFPEAYSVGVACPGSGITSWDQVMAASSVKMINALNGQANTLPRLIVGAYGLQSHVSWIYGFASSTAETAGCLAGNGQVIGTQNMSAFTPQEFTSGQLTPLLLTRAVPRGSAFYSIMKNVPTLGQYYAKHKPTSPAGKAIMEFEIKSWSNPSSINYGLAAPPGTPKPLIAALTKAFQHVATMQSVKNAVLRAGGSPGFIEPQNIVPYINYLLNRTPIFNRILSLTPVN